MKKRWHNSVLRYQRDRAGICPAIQHCIHEGSGCMFEHKDFSSEAAFRFVDEHLLPKDLSNTIRLFQEMQKAHWFWLDILCERSAAALIRYEKFGTFAVEVFKHCPSLAKIRPNFRKLLACFFEYQSHLPRCGGILLNSKLDKVLLVCASWGTLWEFPKGKLEQSDESEVAAAIREVKEECGFDAASRSDPKNFLEWNDGKKRIRLYIYKDVPESYVFYPQTVKEIKDFRWFRVQDLPQTAEQETASGFLQVLPFVEGLQSFILSSSSLIRLHKTRSSSSSRLQKKGSSSIYITLSEEERVLRRQLSSKGKLLLGSIPHS